MTRTITQGDIAAFAALTGDHHPLHVDPAWAQDGPFGSTVAHGLLVLSCAAGLAEFDPERVLALRRVGEVVFKRPVRPGEAIRLESVVEAERPVGDGTALVTQRWRVRGADGRVALTARVEVLWR